MVMERHRIGKAHKALGTSGGQPRDSPFSRQPQSDDAAGANRQSQLMGQGKRVRGYRSLTLSQPQSTGKEAPPVTGWLSTIPP